jgi:hypothetical protein
MQLVCLCPFDHTILAYSPLVRFDTYNASAHLVRQLEASGAFVTHDGGDTVLVELTSGYMVSIHLIETIIPSYEVRLNLRENGAVDIYSMFILWAAMFLPEDGDLFHADPWMQGLISLYGGKVYAFDVFGKDIRIFPAYFEPVAPRIYRVHYGSDIDVSKLTISEAEVKNPEMAGVWRIADFNGSSSPPRRRVHHEARQRHHHRRTNSLIRPESPWDILGVVRGTPRDDIKRAYRRLAQRYHPDLNGSPEATHQMQKVNAAYQAILRELDGTPKA